MPRSIAHAIERRRSQLRFAVRNDAPQGIADR